jgi:MoaA/NifB/PqqE/SkfB family radical SAM enzyme/SAM-dependent methyltransferase
MNGRLPYSRFEDKGDPILTLNAQIRKYAANAGYLFSIGKPGVFKKYLEKYLKAVIFKRITPRQIDIALTFECNLACDHCFTAPLLRKDETEMDRGTLKKVAAECRDLGITVIHFTGGEILLRKDLEEIIGLFDPKNHVIYLQSNGTLATLERLRSLKKAGLDFFGVSLEYPDKRKQDAFRHHEGYYDKTLETLENAKKAGLQTSVNITMDRHLIRSKELPFWIESLGKMGHIVYGNLPVPVGRFRERKDLLWSMDERKILQGLTRRFPFFRTEFDSNFGPYGCPAMKEKIYLCAYGDVLACPYIHLSFGNVKSDRLADIYGRCMAYDVFRSYHEHCLAAEDKEFIRRIIDKTLDFSRQPVFYKAFENELENDPFTRSGILIKKHQPDHTMTETKNRTITDITFEDVPCPGCGSHESSKVIEAPDFETDLGHVFRVVKCGSCGLAYTSPRPDIADLFRYFYPDNYVCYTRSGVADAIRETYLSKSRFKSLKKIFDRLRPDGSTGRFLDVGCSYGYFLSYLKAHTSWDVNGCEPNANMAEKAKAQGLDVTQTTLAEAGYETGSFDLVYMSHVLEHVPDLKETVAEVYRILRPGGIFITENPDFDAPIREIFGPAWWGYHLPRHLTHFTFETMTALLAREGFIVESITPCFRPGPIAWSVQNLLKSKGMPSPISSFFGVQNPAFVALCSIPAWKYLKSGHTDMMETLAVKPGGPTP